MILVIVGTNYFAFDRLIQFVDQVMGQKYDIVMQTGVSVYRPLNCRYKPYFSEDEMHQLVGEADWIICHGGYGIISECLRRGKRIIVVPRRREFGECLDDQEELCRYLEAQSCLICLSDETELVRVVQMNKEFEPNLEFFISDQDIQSAKQIISSFLGDYFPVDPNS